jgi:dipeptidyl aminopeptidase/acylaminoacyl peptidase
MKRLNIQLLNYNTEGFKQESLLFFSAKEKSPTIIFLHGHRSSAWESSLFGYLLSEAGFNVLIPSQVGYGLSEGNPDFCGPRTVDAVIDGINYYLQNYQERSNKFGIWGISRGSTVAALVATKKPEIFSAHIFQSGAYEMKENYETTLQGIRDVFNSEVRDATSKDFFIRSPIYDIKKLKAPSLVLHGEDDERILVEQAKSLDKALNDQKKVHQTVILKNVGHFITKVTREEYSIPFLKKYLS